MDSKETQMKQFDSWEQLVGEYCKAYAEKYPASYDAGMEADLLDALYSDRIDESEIVLMLEKL